VRIERVRGGIWIALAVFGILIIYQIVINPTSFREWFLTDYLPKASDIIGQKIDLGSDIKLVVRMTSSLPVLSLDIMLRTFAWWLVLFYGLSGLGLDTWAEESAEGRTIFIPPPTAYRLRIFVIVLVVGLLYLVKDYAIYLLMVDKGLDPNSAKWITLMSVFGVLSMLVTTLIWVWLPLAFYRWIGWKVLLFVVGDRIQSLMVPIRCFMSYWFAAAIQFVILAVVFMPMSALDMLLSLLLSLIPWLVAAILSSLWLSVVTRIGEFYLDYEVMGR
jgi:hypothetical protein